MNAEPSPGESPGPSGKATLGRLLRTERERRGIKLVKIAAETRVGVHYLAALEHSDYDELPGEVFTKSYVRAYAEFLGLDADEMAELYLSETVDRRAAESHEADQKMVREMSRVLNVSPDRSRYPLWIASATVLLLLAVAVGWWWLAEPAPGAATQPAATQPAATQPTVTQPTVTQPTVTRPTAIDIAEPRVVETLEPATHANRVATERRAESESAERGAPIALTGSVGSSPVVAVVSDFGVGSGVRGRTLIGRGDRFREGSEVWFWNRVTDAEPGTILQHVWLHEGTEVSRVALAIGASHWRTQSRKTLFPGSVGRWAVEVRDSHGKTLARAEFLCEESI